MPAADLEAGLRAYLLTGADLTALVGAHVYAGELPAALAPDMPRKALLVRSSGGVSLTAGSHVEHDTQRVDLFGFGETPHEAALVAKTAGLHLRRLRRSVHAGVLLHWAQPAGGSNSGREPDTEWPRHFQSFQIMHGLEEVS